MIKKSTLLHLRVPFSFFLLPVYLFALSLSPSAPIFNVVVVLVIIHFFLYPASNGFNSYFDKDTGSIGGLEKPPEVSKELYNVSLLFDLVALFLGFLINWQFVIMMLIYGAISKAYSHPMIRLKKWAFTGWFMAGLFQGFFTFIMVYIGINKISVHEVAPGQVYFAAFLCSVLLWGSYPMTQIYQHEEDSGRGDYTLSFKLGILGTFYFTAGAFILADLGFLYFYLTYYSDSFAILFQAFIVPMILFFAYWYYQVLKNPNAANYRNTMRLNTISAVCLNIFFLIMFILHSFERLPY
ncbi:MAG: UbiA family prenyltransferase [Bacteroidota bacterium]|nr:UbiA family prenyltransferase [Bacteroidota bacterium]